ncbi:PHD finger protein At3g20280-like [Zingiber officinale]|nr:PHD finger protein At3g20280-like [Zingiber officinale]
MQSPSVATVSRFSQPNKLLDHTSIRLEGIAGANDSQSSHQMKNQEIKSSIVQAGHGGLHITHQPTQGLAFFHAPALYTNHNEIGKSVQRILQSKVLDHPNWIPPSSDYMNASLNCQICKNVISDTESLLVCDACEKGNHLKCLQSYGSKDIPKAEWHCPSCLASSNGKTLPPKYGRVTRAPVPAPRAAPNTSINVASKKTEDLDPNTSQQKALANSNSYLSQHSNSSNLGGSHYDSMVIGAEMDSRTNGVKRDNEKCDAVGDHLEETNGSVCANSDASCGYPNDIENDSLASSNTKETTEPVLQTNTVDKSSCEHSQSLVGGNYHFSKATFAPDSDQDLSSNDRISGNHLQESSSTTTSEPEGHGEKKPPECIDASSVEVVSEGSLQVTADESKGLIS